MLYISKIITLRVKNVYQKVFLMKNVGDVLEIFMHKISYQPPK